MAKDESERISAKQVQHVAELAKIELTEEEKNIFTEQLNAILDYFKILDDADTSEVQPMLSVLGLQNVWREDLPHPSLSVEEALENSPRKERGYVKAPKIV
ncbi:Asp-tRNA(Asn)/Glu-tRNA(Gln) amidotransferase subunit GatC [Candidatus Bathyarchaeota archaeon]|nr:Asp-tRNA(Asn)/Glu-tRNA(Gln) amidotransferase subunit GatC [Candidatus Bathyarchaeota archaeon]